METTMNDREVFEAVLEKVKRNGIEIKRPYNDTYIQIYIGDRKVGEMNYGGYNVLRNINKLVEILQDDAHDLLK